LGKDELRSLLEILDPKARDDLRRLLIRDQADRDAVASQLLRYRDGHGDEGRHHRLPDDVPGGAAEGREAARRDRSLVSVTVARPLGGLDLRGPKQTVGRTEELM